MKTIYKSIAFYFCVLIAVDASAQCDSLGPNTAGTFVNDASIGAYQWMNIPNAQLSDDIWSENTLMMLLGASNYLKATDFGFNIPSSATVCGIQLAVERMGGGAVTMDLDIRLVKADSVTGSNHYNNIPWGNEMVVTYGDSTDLWGTTWTPADINDAGFGAAVAAMYMGGSHYVVRVDQVTIKVYYTVTVGIAGNQSTQDGIAVFPNPTTGIVSVSGAAGPVQVFDLMGNLVLATPEQEVDLSAYPNGVYFVNVGEQTQKLILTK